MHTPSTAVALSVLVAQIGWDVHRLVRLGLLLLWQQALPERVHPHL